MVFVRKRGIGSGTHVLEQLAFSATAAAQNKDDLAARRPLDAIHANDGVVATCANRIPCLLASASIAACSAIKRPEHLCIWKALFDRNRLCFRFINHRKFALAFHCCSLH